MTTPSKNGLYIVNCRSNLGQVAIQIRNATAYWGHKFDAPVPFGVIQKATSWRRVRFVRDSEPQDIAPPKPKPVLLPSTTPDEVVHALNAAGVPWQIDPLDMLRKEFYSIYGDQLLGNLREDVFALFCVARGIKR